MTKSPYPTIQQTDGRGAWPSLSMACWILRILPAGSRPRPRIPFGGQRGRRAYKGHDAPVASADCNTPPSGLGWAVQPHTAGSSCARTALPFIKFKLRSADLHHQWAAVRAFALPSTTAAYSFATIGPLVHIQKSRERLPGSLLP